VSQRLAKLIGPREAVIGCRGCRAPIFRYANARVAAMRLALGANRPEIDVGVDRGRFVKECERLRPVA
jgi:hypothetical protein